MEICFHCKDFGTIKMRRFNSYDYDKLSNWNLPDYVQGII